MSITSYTTRSLNAAIRQVRQFTCLPLEVAPVAAGCEDQRHRLVCRLLPPYSLLDENIPWLIIDDLNVRSGEEETLYEEMDEKYKERRCSEDKMCNKEGKELIRWLNENGLMILNGKCEADREGRNTYVSKKGQSVIYYAIMNYATCELVDTLNIVESENIVLIAKGVKQCCPLSATLFHIHLSDIDTWLQKTIFGGIKIGEKIIFSLIYADDIVVVSDSPESLKLVIKQLEDYTKK